MDVGDVMRLLFVFQTCGLYSGECRSNMTCGDEEQGEGRKGDGGRGGTVNYRTDGARPIVQENGIDDHNDSTIQRAEWVQKLKHNKCTPGNIVAVCKKCN